MSKKTTDKKRIVVLGGGFAGLNFIKSIDHKIYDVTLIDKHNYHTFPPLFYQVASSGLDSTSISFPFRREFRKACARGTHLIMSEVTEVDDVRKVVVTPWATVPYDILVIALGTTNNFFGQPDLIKRVYTLKSAAQAIRCRNDILDHLERAVATRDPELRRRLLSFVVIGGGPTGVEIAGALGEMKRYILPREYPDLNPDEVNITLLEGMPRVLGTMSEVASEKALKYLGELMVEVRTGTLMKSYEEDLVTLSDGSTLEAGLVIWTAGVTGTPFPIINANGNDIARARGNRLEVDGTSAVKGLENVYAIGDIALMTSDPAYPSGHPQLAQVAIQSAKNLAKNLNKGTSRQFEYYDKGTMATIGRNKAVVDLKHLKFGGFPAWLTWMFIHLITLLGMRNKITVLINWLWAYFSYSTSLRLIMHPNKYPLRSRWGEK
ncbi:MAG: NAD(P)/FAD-dependent oxidoreductase [Muribaculaceae bacterium]|nr:NAD(P)/FAD-dependent oxidoreductase [Muribaculaceae bacterium]